MEKGKLIAFRTGETYSHEYLLKHITNEELNECVEKGYFNVVEKDELGEKEKNMFSLKRAKSLPGNNLKITAGMIERLCFFRLFIILAVCLLIS